MLNKNQYEKYFYFGMLAGISIFLINLYYFSHPFWKGIGLTWEILDNLCLRLYRGGAFERSYRTKIIALVLIAMGMMSRNSRSRLVEWYYVAGVGVISGIAYLYPFPSAIMYAAFSGTGLIGLSWVIGMISRRETGAIINDDNETFMQCNEKIENENSVNLPTVYQYQKKKHKGWINVVNPFRATFVLGNPGSGKSYSVFEPFIEQMIMKGYAMFLYDYKYPTLSVNAYNKLLQYKDNYDVKPEFCVLNFDDPRHSFRANPLDPKFLEDQADCTEIADLIMLSVNKVAREKTDFFTESSKTLIDGIFWFLRNYEGGKYCTFPHALEFMAQDYRKVIGLLVSDPDIKAKISSFSDAYFAGANEQLQGMLSSAKIPLSKFQSKNLYWALTGDDFSLDINDPKHPKILCVGNNPKRDYIYSTTISLYTSRMFKCISFPGKRKCSVIIDELPTIFLLGLDKIINTCRSFLVAFVGGAQDISQLIRDYGQKDADVILNTPGNVFVGQVSGKTAKAYSAAYGKEDKVRESESIGRNNESVSISMQKDELISTRKIETLSTGTFFGKVSDTFSEKVERKLFCGEIIRDNKKVAKEKKTWVDMPVLTDFGEEQIRRDVMQDTEYHIRERIAAEMRSSGAIYHPDDLKKKVDRQYAKMTRKEKRDAIEEIIEDKVTTMVNVILEANFRRIQREAAEIIEKAWSDDEDAGVSNQSDSPMPPPIDIAAFMDPWHDL